MYLLHNQPERQSIRNGEELRTTIKIKQTKTIRTFAPLHRCGLSSKRQNAKTNPIAVAVYRQNGKELSKGAKPLRYRNKSNVRGRYVNQRGGGCKIRGVERVRAPPLLYRV